MTPVTFTIPKNSYSNDSVMKLMMGQAVDSMNQHWKEVSTVSEAGLRGAQAGEARAQTGKIQEETRQLKEAGGEDVGAETVDAIGQGRVIAPKLQRMLAKSPGILNQVLKKYPDFDQSKVDSYANTYKNFTSGKDSTAINSGGAAMTHMENLLRLNTIDSLNPLSAASGRYQNQLTTLATELAKFYGDPSVSGIQAIKDSLGSNIPWKRQAAIETQLQSMGVKMDQYENEWKNAAPSKQYQAPMPSLSNEAKNSRAHIDPAYAQKVHMTPQPATATQKVPGQDGNTYWVDAQGNNLGMAFFGTE
jgi:hypothetical protein